MPADRNTPGILGTRAFAANGAVDFTYVPRKGHSKVELLVEADQAGTSEVLTINFPNNEAQEIAPVAVVAGTPLRQELDFPVSGMIIVRFTNNNATAGVASVRAIDDGGR